MWRIEYIFQNEIEGVARALERYDIVWRYSFPTVDRGQGSDESVVQIRSVVDHNDPRINSPTETVSDLTEERMKEKYQD